MKKLVINEENLSLSEVNDIVTRVKCFIQNSDGKVILASTADGCMQLPGGHVEEGEDLTQAAIREVEEETGIKLDENDSIEMFYNYDKYKKNAHGSGKNKLRRIFYFHVKTDKKINVDNTNMTEHEKNAGFFVGFLTVCEIERMLIENSQKHEIPIYRTVAKETLAALDIFKEIIKK